MKYVITLSSIRTRSGMKSGLLLQESYSSKFTLDKQQTAVRSSFVGSVISLHKFD